MRKLALPHPLRWAAALLIGATSLGLALLVHSAAGAAPAAAPAPATEPAGEPSAIEPQYAQFECRWADGPIEIDGKADEPAWKHAQVIDKFYLPWLGKDAKLAKTSTKAKLLWDREYVYFFAEMEDADVFTDIKEHDGPIWTRDCFEIFFKPSKEKPGYYEFEFNPLNAVLDMYIPKRSPDAWLKYGKDLEFEMKTAVQIRGTLNKHDDKDEGWSVEGRIAWRSFIRSGGRPNPSDVWTFTLCRVDGAKGREGTDLSVCAPLLGPKPNFHKWEDYSPIKFVGPNVAPVPPPAEAPKKAAGEGTGATLPPLTTSTVIGAPEPPPPYRVAKAYPKLKLPFPITVIRVPGTNQMLAVSADSTYAPSRVVRFTDDPDVDHYDTLFQTDAVVYDFTFHPKFAENGYVFAGMNEKFSAPKGVMKQTKVVRYTVDLKANPITIDPNSAVEIIAWDSDGHNGGSPGFGPDGMLYVTSGDGTSDSDEWLSGQDLSRMLAKTLRIDVDHPDAGKQYSVPKDNPFVGIEGVRPETWAYGFRNPWRLRFDQKTGDLWVTQNGQDQWEQVYLVQKGANYGWSANEGSHPFYPDRKKGKDITPPTAEHPHSEARSLTGGLVYYGDVLPDLRGAYIYGDYSTGRIWGVRHDGPKVTWHQDLAHTRLKITGFSVNGRGELLVLDHARDGGPYKLELAPPAAASVTFPRKLSESGLFTNVAKHEMQPGLLPYTVNAELWSDGAYKARYMALPGTGDTRRITFKPENGFDFPDGAVLVKSFALESDAGKPETRHWIETRFLTKQGGEWAGYTYAWNKDGTDADLVDAGGQDKSFDVHDPGAAGGVRKQPWHYPSRTECMVCHSRAANFVLGPSVLQLNRDYQYPDGHVENQLAALERLGLLKVNWFEDAAKAIRNDGKRRGLTGDALDKFVRAQLQEEEDARKEPKSTLLSKAPAEYPKLVNPYDEHADVEARARSYLHANCAICHIEAGGGNAKMELGFTTPRNGMRIFDTAPLHNTFGVTDAKLAASGHPEQSVLPLRMNIRNAPGQMPPLATYVVDQRAVELMKKWIAEVKPASEKPEKGNQ